LPTYTEAALVDDDEGLARLGRALQDDKLRDELYTAIGDGMAELRGARSTEDAQLDRLSKALAKSRPKAAAQGPAVAALLVAIDEAAGVGSGAAGALQSEKGQALYKAGLATLGRHLAKGWLK
jgi:hypothetical protein